jgi:CHAD domain-containing protein
MRFKNLTCLLRKLGMHLGHIRELDVAIQTADHFGFETRELKKKCKDSRRKLSDWFSQDQSDYFSFQFAEAKYIVSTTSSILVDEARDNLREHLVQQLKAHVHGQSKLHQLRISMKKTRYVLEAMGRPTEALKGFQELLGKSHDLEFLQQMIGKKHRLKAEKNEFNRQAIMLAGPTFQFAIEQLGLN